MKLKPLPKHILSFLHLGDSYTIGEGVPAAQAWPGQLKRMLEVKGRRIRDMCILARTGWTSSDLLEAMEKADLEANRDLVTLCIGVNNQYQGRELQDFRRDLMHLLKRAISLINEDGQVILLSIPDWSVSPFAAQHNKAAVRDAIERFNDVCFRTAESMDVAYIEWTSLTRLFVDEDNAFVEDGLHPSAGQYREWATFLIQHLIPGI